MFTVKKIEENPLLKPIRSHAWEGFATFNWCPTQGKDDPVHVLYRALSLPDPLLEQKQISTIGHALSQDGIHFNQRKELITPKEDWEKYGCEDPRITKWGNSYYIFYTALSVYPFSQEGIKVAVAKTKDFETIIERHLVTPFNAKAMALFPEPISGKMTVILSVDTDEPPVHLAIRQLEKEEDLWNEDLWNEWYKNLDEYSIDPKRSQYDHVEVGAPPIKTPHGWLLIYSHIENYFPNPNNFQKIFGIEALLLDIDDPKKIIGKTKGPIITPTEYYEREGYVRDVVFPSGARVVGKKLQIFYGAADTTSCIAEVSLEDLIKSINPTTSASYNFTRHNANPILLPNENNPWEAKAVFNPAAIDLDGKVHIVYRAMGNDNTSVMGYASSHNGLDIDEKLSEPIYTPRADFEQKKRSGNSGCEDPRIIKIKDTIYMFYTAFNAIGPAQVAVSSITCNDFIHHIWNWSYPILITPGGIDDKDACIFPESFNNKYLFFHRIENNICADWFNSLNFEKEKVNRCIEILAPRRGMWDSVKVGVTAPPIKTNEGWLLLYHAVSANHTVYRVGATLLDLYNPTIMISRSTDPIFEPKEKYEKEGIVSNVVFPCGAIVRDKTIFLYYGGADEVVCVATMNIDKILNTLRVS